MKRLPLWLAIIALLGANFVTWQVVSLSFRSSSRPAGNPPLSISESPNQVAAHPPATTEKISFTVPILMYHYIRAYNDPGDQLGIQLSVSPDQLKRQLQKIKEAGYETISLEDYYRHQLKSKSIILTFDDGYDNHYTAALPILQEMEMTATFFIVRNFIDRAGYLTAAQISALKAAGMEIGAHTLSHRNLATASLPIAAQEIVRSFKNTQPVFAYPSGLYNQVTLDILRAGQVHTAVTTKLGVATNLSPLLELPRIRVKENTDILEVIKKETDKLTSQ